MLADCEADIVGLKTRLQSAARHGLNNHDAQTLLLILITESLERIETLLGAEEAPAQKGLRKVGAGRNAKWS